MKDDVISRQAAIDIERNATVDTNPSHFEAHQKFTQFMDDAEVSSFGRWQWSNGFNTALTAVGIDLKKLPSVQPDHNADIGKKVERTDETAQNVSDSDLVSRKAAIDALDEQIEQCNKALGSFDISPKDEYAIKVERASLKAYKEQLENMPSAQPEIIRCKDCRFNYGTAYCLFHFRDVKGEGFCSWTERKTDG